MPHKKAHADQKAPAVKKTPLPKKAAEKRTAAKKAAAPAAPGSGKPTLDEVLSRMGEQIEAQRKNPIFAGHSVNQVSRSARDTIVHMVLIGSIMTPLSGKQLQHYIADYLKITEK